jgi:FixJ family two-component response regulator
VAANSIISIVDDDQSVRQSLASLLRSVGFAVRAFGSAEDFLKAGQPGATGCLLLDLRMPGMSGLELQLAAAGVRVPSVFLTAHGDEEARARALRAGAVAFLTKPFSENALLDAVRVALSR